MKKIIIGWTTKDWIENFYADKQKPDNCIRFPYVWPTNEGFYAKIKITIEEII